jgi:hypothetical protein
MKHENDERIKQSTCPGCGNHLPSKNGLMLGRLVAQQDELSTLNGLQPDSVFAVASTAIQFWCAGRALRER